MEEYQQEQQQPFQQSFQSSPLNNLGSTVLVLTDPEDNLYETELMIRGLTKDKMTGELRKETKALMNDTGSKMVIGLAHDFLSRNCNMSNLEDMREVDALRNDLAEDLRELLMVNRLIFDIKHETFRDVITGKIIRQAHLSLKRAYLEGDKRFLKSSHHEVTQKIDAPSRQKQGWMSWLSPN